MRLNPAAFNRFLGKGGIGQTVLYRRAYACACVNPDSGAPDPKHALCNGKGRLWDSPVETVIGVAHQSATPEMIAAGQYENGDMVMSIPENSPAYDAGQYDRFLLLNSTDVFSEPKKRGGPKERILFTVKEFKRVFWLDGNRLPVDGGLPTIDGLGNLSWPNGDGPPDGVTYSITGIKYDEYFLPFSMPSDRGEHQGARLPKKVTARVFDLFNRMKVV